MRDFVIVWSGQAVSAIGSGLTSFALGMWIYLETGSTTLFAINLLAVTVPSIILAPIMGVFIDRWDRRWIMLINDLGAALSSLAIFLLLIGGNLQVWHIYLATFFNAAFSAFQWTAYSAATTLLVPREQLGRAGGMTQIGDAASMLISPFVAGALFVTIGLQGIIMIDFLTFGAAIITLLTVRIPRPEPVDEASTETLSFFRKALFGWDYLRQSRSLLGLLIYFAVVYFAVGIMEALLEPMLLDITDPKSVGLIFSIMGAGALAGTIIMSLWGGPKRRALGILLTGIVQGVIMIGYGWSTSLVVITAAIFLFSLIDPIVNGSSQAFWQAKIAPGLQGRVFAMRRVISRLALTLAIAVAGPLADRLFNPLFMEGGALANSLGQVIGTGAGRGTGFLFILLGGLISLVSILALSYPALRKMDTTIPDAVPDEGLSTAYQEASSG
jgi:DHA3 family macrolide efflux protein-like MFS transporter